MACAARKDWFAGNSPADLTIAIELRRCGFGPRMSEWGCMLEMGVGAKE